MKYIEKGQSPDFFEEWKEEKERSSWGELQNPEKGHLRLHLLKEQGYICCYCNQKIPNHPLRSKIEHLFPKDKEKYPEKMFDFDNLFIACNGGERDAPPITLHCDSKKGANEPPPIIPTQINCANYFSYDSNGEISGVGDDAEKTIKELNLDIEKLNILRKTAINEFFDIYVEEATEEELRILLEDLEEMVDGEYVPFCKAIQFVLGEIYL